MPKILRTNWRQIDPIHHVSHVRRNLDDVGHRPALRFDEGLDCRERAARLALEIAAMRRTAVRRTGHLTGEKEYRLGLTALDSLTIGGGFEHTRCVEFFYGDHIRCAPKG